MADNTGIEWATATWNSIVGCSKVSAGCDNCYAEKMAHRLANNPATRATYSHISDSGKWNGRCVMYSKALEKPMQWKKPRRIFVNSMGDLFHLRVPFEWIDQVMHTVHHCPQHTFMILTKRPERMFDYFSQYTKTYGSPANNLWLGVSVEDQESASDRIPTLALTPAAKRFISIEPLLSPVSLRWIGGDFLRDSVTGIATHYDAVKLLDWIIVGGESSPGARPIDPEWVRVLRDQAEENNIPFMFKGWGKNPNFCMQDAAKGCRTPRCLDGVEYHAFPEQRRG